jgi:Na+/H+ antiporter NhaC
LSICGVLVYFCGNIKEDNDATTCGIMFLVTLMFFILTGVILCVLGIRSMGEEENRNDLRRDHGCYYQTGYLQKSGYQNV